MPHICDTPVWGREISGSNPLGTGLNHNVLNTKPPLDCWRIKLRYHYFPVINTKNQNEYL